MKLTILGSSHGVPEKTRKCTSLMLEAGGKIYIFDAGLMLMSELRSREVDLSKAENVFITHSHGDHTDGLIEFCDLCTWYFRDIHPVIWVPEMKIRELIANWISFTTGSDVNDSIPKFKEIHEGLFFDDGIIKVYAYNNDHLPDRPSYSFMIEAENKRVVLTGDMSGKKYADFPKWPFEKDCDLVVTEAAHCRLTDCLDVFSKVKTKSLIVSHIVPWNVPEAEKLAELMPYTVKTAFDGMETEI